MNEIFVQKQRFVNIALKNLKVHKWRFENLTICLCSYKNNRLIISHFQSTEFLSYLRVKFVFELLKSRLIFNKFYCLWVFVHKDFFIYHDEHFDDVIVLLSQKVEDFLLWNRRHIILIWRRRYWQISASMHL